MYWLGKSQGTTATAARKATSARPDTRPGSAFTTAARRPLRSEIHQAELALAPLDDHDVALGEPPVLLGREGEDAAHAPVLLDELLEAGADLAALPAVGSGDGLRDHADAVPGLAA